QACTQHRPTVLAPIFLQRLCAHPALHSFPTRRSSDLGKAFRSRDPLIWNLIERIVRLSLSVRLFVAQAPMSHVADDTDNATRTPDRKSTRLNSSHGSISYAVFCLKKKKNQ